MPAAYRTTLGSLAAEQVDAIVGKLATAEADRTHGTTQNDQIAAWRVGLAVLLELRSFLLERLPEAASWGLLLEYTVPRRYSRLDAVLLARDVVIVIEFKVGATTYQPGARWQVECYCRDLCDFHAESARRPVVP